MRADSKARGRRIRPYSTDEERRWRRCSSDRIGQVILTRALRAVRKRMNTCWPKGSLQEGKAGFDLSLFLFVVSEFVVDHDA